MADKFFRAGPTAMPTAATNLVRCPTATAAGTGIAAQTVTALIRHIRIVNKTAATCTFTLFIGDSAGSAAGTEFGAGLTVVPAYGVWEWYGMLRLDYGASSEVLSETCQTVTSLVFEAEGTLSLA